MNEYLSKIEDHFPPLALVAGVLLFPLGLIICCAMKVKHDFGDLLCLVCFGLANLVLFGLVCPGQLVCLAYLVCLVWHESFSFLFVSSSAVPWRLNLIFCGLHCLGFLGLVNLVFFVLGLIICCAMKVKHDFGGLVWSMLVNFGKFWSILLVWSMIVCCTMKVKPDFGGFVNLVLFGLVWIGQFGLLGQFGLFCLAWVLFFPLGLINDHWLCYEGKTWFWWFALVNLVCLLWVAWPIYVAWFSLSPWSGHLLVSEDDNAVSNNFFEIYMKTLHKFYIFPMISNATHFEWAPTSPPYSINHKCRKRSVSVVIASLHHDI